MFWDGWKITGESTEVDKPELKVNWETAASPTNRICLVSSRLASLQVNYPPFTVPPLQHVSQNKWSVFVLTDWCLFLYSAPHLMTAFKGARKPVRNGRCWILDTGWMHSGTLRRINFKWNTICKTCGGRTTTSALRTRDANYAMLRLLLPRPVDVNVSSSSLAHSFTCYIHCLSSSQSPRIFSTVPDFTITLSIQETVSQTKGSLWKLEKACSQTSWVYIRNRPFLK